MDFNDIIYLLALIFSICFGKYVNQILDVDRKQNISTLAGFAIVLLISGFQFVYPIVLVAVNAFFILTSRRYAHIFTFVFNFTFLTVLRYHQCLSGQTNLIQMMLTLKLIGLSFELKDNRRLLSEINSGHEDLDHAENLKYLLLPQSEIHLSNIVHYSFCYVGVLTGPYYKYQTYLDWFNPRIHATSSSNVLSVLSRLKFLPLYATIFLILSYFYSVQYVLSDQFYASHSCLYRWLYALPVFLAFKMRLYSGLLLSEAVAIMVGLGCYPEFTESRPGQGPTTSVIAFRKIALGETELQPFQRGPPDFSTVHSVSVLAVETEPTLRRTIKLWNTTVQFWMNQFVYKRVTNHKLRLYVVFFISALWHGVHSGYYLSLCYMPVYMYIEDLYEIKVRSRLHGKMWSLSLDLLLLLSKTLTLSSLSICFTLLSLPAISRYFLSIYCLPLLLHLLLYLGAASFIQATPLTMLSTRNRVSASSFTGNIVDATFPGNRVNAACFTGNIVDAATFPPGNRVNTPRGFLRNVNDLISHYWKRSADIVNNNNYNNNSYKNNNSNNKNNNVYPEKLSIESKIYNVVKSS